ncbi:MAG: agmatine deiminase family protein [Desulfuromusa sp.]|nr:agmatine deiminase family protein [Desulfuromusa sp.]
MGHHSINTRRLPAEWEPQDAILLAWPHKHTDWQPILNQVIEVYSELIRQISRFESIIIIAPELNIVRETLERTDLDFTRISLHQIETNDTWTRDFGPFTVYDNNQPQLLDFNFNGWGQKFPADKDNQATRHLHDTGIFKKIQRQSSDLILEGGSIESDGSGTLLTTSACLLNTNRNPHLDRVNLESKLSKQLGFDHFLWLDHGWLTGDDTDSHIDTLARLCPNDTIVYIHCDNQDDEHYPALKKMESQLKQFKTKKGQPFRLLSLPWPQACYGGKDRLPASYANFLIINQAVLVPTYNDPADILAMEVIKEAFPDRQVIGIDCLPLIKQHGSLHCITMQLPQGVLS